MDSFLAFSASGTTNSSKSVYGTLFSSISNTMTYWSVGVPTVATSIPVTGSAVYVGMLEGSIGNVNKTNTQQLIAALNLTANFATRSVAFATSGTLMFDNNVALSGAKQLTFSPNNNIAGTLTYLAGSSTFSGQVNTSATGGFTGTAQGRFYGLTAGKPAEAGGLISLSNATTGDKLAGIFGAKTGGNVTTLPAVYAPLVANFNVAYNTLGGGGTVLNTQTVTAATVSANSLTFYRLPMGLGTVGMDYKFTTKPAVAAKAATATTPAVLAVPATIVQGQVTAASLSTTGIRSNYDGVSDWLPTTSKYDTSYTFDPVTGMPTFSNNTISIQSAAPSNTYQYSDFGLWLNTSTSSYNGTGGALNVGGYYNTTSGQFLSVGVPTLGSTIPTTGTGTYAGTAVGYYQGTPIPATNPLSPSAPAPIQLLTADVNATANFATRSMAFSTTASQLTSSSGVGCCISTPNTITAAPTLNMTANLTWAAGANAFSGAVKAQGAGTALAPALNGSLQGRFYGPVAGAVGAAKPLEIGGVFSLTSTAGAKMSGAFGAK